MSPPNGKWVGGPFFISFDDRQGDYGFRHDPKAICVPNNEGTPVWSSANRPSTSTESSR